MGEVYRARDGKLGQDVAIKVFSDEFAENEERLARFEREAKLLAQLNHSNIATLHGLERIAASPGNSRSTCPLFEARAAGGRSQPTEAHTLDGTRITPSSST